MKGGRKGGREVSKMQKEQEISISMNYLFSTLLFLFLAPSLSLLLLLFSLYVLWHTIIILSIHTEY